MEPAQVIDHFIKLFNSRDLNGLIEELYEEDVILVPSAENTGTVSGKKAVREILQAFLDLGGTMRLVAGAAFPRGDIALTHSHWRLDIAGSDPLEGVTAEVVRRQPDGSWKYVIDNPWGGAVLGATA